MGVITIFVWSLSPITKHYPVDRQDMFYEPKDPTYEDGASSSECELEVWSVLNDDAPTSNSRHKNQSSSSHLRNDIEVSDVVEKHEANTCVLKCYELISERSHAASCELQAGSGDCGNGR
eukprot:1815864-Karenia_brevis.AAC.1